MVHRVMAEKPSMKRRRQAEDDDDIDKNGAHVIHWKKQMIKRAENDDETWKNNIDENLKIGFRKILKDLIAQSRSWAFSEPPEVKIPADLAAVEGKLKQNKYSGAKEFVDDVRLALKRAKPYSPRWAAVLDANFMRQWKLMEAKITCSKDDQLHLGSCNGHYYSSSSSSSSSTSISVDDVMSAEKALRAAMLKTRFADTINRATQTLLIGDHKKSHLPRKLIQQEKSKELKMRRQRERRALEEMERRAQVDDSTVATTLKMLFGATAYPSPEPLQRLGLYIIREEEDDENSTACLDEYSFSYSS